MNAADNRNLRVQIFAPHYAAYALELSNAMSRSANVLLVLNEKNAANEIGSELQQRPGLKVIRFNSVGRLARAFAYCRIILATALFRPALISVQEEEGRFTAWIVRAISKFAPIITTIHDPLPHSGSDETYAKLNAAHILASRSVARAFHVHGDYCRRALLSYTNDDRPILSTQHGVIMKPTALERFGPEPGRVLMFGRMEEYKGLEVFLDAITTLNSIGLKITAILAGKGPDLARLSGKIAALDNVETMDRYLSEQDAIFQIQSASFIVLPYLNATQSGVVAAAFANGRPVIASKTGGLVDSVRHGINGILVPAGDAAALAGAIEALVNDEDMLLRLSKGAAYSAETDFSWSQIADEFIAFSSHHLLEDKRH